MIMEATMDAIYFALKCFAVGLLCGLAVGGTVCLALRRRIGRSEI